MEGHIKISIEINCGLSVYVYKLGFNGDETHAINMFYAYRGYTMDMGWHSEVIARGSEYDELVLKLFVHSATLSLAKASCAIFGHWCRMTSELEGLDCDIAYCSMVKRNVLISKREIWRCNPFLSSRCEECGTIRRLTLSMEDHMRNQHGLNLSIPYIEEFDKYYERNPSVPALETDSDNETDSGNNSDYAGMD